MLILNVALDKLAFRRVTTKLVVVASPTAFVYDIITLVSPFNHKGLPT